MHNFLMNWNYKKHALAVSSIFLGVAVFGNSLLGKPVPKDERSLNPLNTCKKMTTAQWVFNGIVSFAYLVDMTVTFFGLNHLKKQYK